MPAFCRAASERPSLALLLLLLQTTRGDLWVVFSVAFPRIITPQQSEQLQALFGATEEWQRQAGVHGEQHEEL